MRWAQSSNPGFEDKHTGCSGGHVRNRATGQLCDALGCSPPLVQLGAAEPRAQRGGGPSAGLPHP